MKTMKKKKLAVIGIAGVAGMLYSATPASAQTFYQCMPIKCKTGEYASGGGECKRCTGGYRCPGDNKRYACTGEWEYAFPGSSRCSTFGPSDIENMELLVGAGGCSPGNFASIYVRLKNLKVANNRYYNFAVSIPHYKTPAIPEYVIYTHCNAVQNDYEDQILCKDIQKVIVKSRGVGGGGCFSLTQGSKEFPNVVFVPDSGKCMSYWKDEHGRQGFDTLDKCKY